MGTLAFEQTLALTKIIAGIGMGLGTLEALYIRNEYRSRGLFSWEVLSTLEIVTLKGIWARALAIVLGTKVFDVILLLRGVAAALLITVPQGSSAEVFCLLSVLGVSLLTHLRNPYGLDGADQMYAIIYGALFLGSLAPDNQIVRLASLGFIASQACLSYSTAGFAKLISPVWRNGEAIRGILGTRTYGLVSVAKLLDANACLCIVIGWMVVLPESIFPAAVLAGPPVLLGLLVWGVFFHFLNAVVMGLNTFLWSFLATYPAVWYCSCQLYGIRHPEWSSQ